MAATFTLSFMQLTDGTIRARVKATAGDFEKQWIITKANWTTILTTVGTGNLGAIAPGTADVEDLTANNGIQAGQVGVLVGAS